MIPIQKYLIHIYTVIYTIYVATITQQGAAFAIKNSYFPNTYSQ